MLQELYASRLLEGQSRDLLWVRSIIDHSDGCLPVGAAPSLAGRVAGALPGVIGSGPSSPLSPLVSLLPCEQQQPVAFAPFVWPSFLYPEAFFVL
jgi:hypothetical protein